MDPAWRSRLEEQDVRQAAMAVFEAESSRKKVIQDSIDYSLFVEASLEASLEESVAESIAHVLYMASLRASAEMAERLALAEAAASEVLEEASRKALRESIAESSRLAAEEESRYQAWLEESSRQAVAEASRRAAEEASRRAAWLAESSRQAAAEASRRAVAEASRQAASKTTAAPVSNPPAATGGETVLIGDSRTSGLIYAGCYPKSLVFFTYNPINQEPGLATQAAARYPAKVVFLNGVDDVLVYGSQTAAQNYEAYIRNFQSMSPATAIYVSNVLPVINQPPGSRLQGIPDFNVRVQEMCARNGWHYIDTSAGYSADIAFKENGDGIHFTDSFTRHWFNNIRALAGF